MKFNFITVISAIMIFTDPFVFFRFFFNNDIIASIAMIVSVIFLILKFLSFPNDTNNKNKYRKSLFLIVFFCFYSFLIYLNSSISYSNLFLHSIKLLTFIAVGISFKSYKGRDILFQSMFIALIFHTIAILPFDFISDRIDLYTNYSSEENIIFGFLKRATGFFTAPGYLILFCSLIIFVSYFRYLKDFQIKYLVIAFILGISTFNRSFLIILVIFLIFNLKNLKFNFRPLAFAFLILIIYQFNKESFQLYADYITLRFQDDSFEDSTRLYGASGLFDSLESIKLNFFGSAISNNGGSLQLVSDKGFFLDPHVGIIYLFGIYGIPMGILISIIITKLSFLLKYINVKKSFFGVSFIAVNAICLVEPLMENTIYLFTILGVYYEKPK